ncbi:di-heme oxidoredictase family protein [Marinicellulosiphila megalodicopiae]|uniref:di-heme oxidoreductase family protein n=1 Tax=Marinicellulosiphila megalodicopiae TaxID=2724896 RepID=UPI003BB0A7EE
MKKILQLLPLILPIYTFSNPLLPGGQTSQPFINKYSFNQEANNLTLEEKLDFSVGNGFFKNPWIFSPATTIARDGLGPLFNTNSCEKCHIQDGRGERLVQTGTQKVSTLIRLSIPAVTSEQITNQLKYGPIPDPIYGGQFQPLSSPNVPAEGVVNVIWHSKIEILADNTEIELQWPEISLNQLQYGELNEQIQLSPRIAPAMMGLGLLEQIDELDILQNQINQTHRTDEIKGKINWVWDRQKQSTSIGKFGWKASQPTLNQQNAAAFHGDLGLTSSLFDHPTCTNHQTACLQAPNGGEFEVSNNILAFIEHYTRHLNVPKRSKLEPEGEKIFHDAKCAICHRPSYITKTQNKLPALSNQTIYPYTDLLLHDLGPLLATNEEFLATQSQWRTAPLWGLGKHKLVSSEIALLHDGRATSILEAILWHGGEAQESVKIVKQLSSEQRQSLLAFLESL